MGLHEVRPLWGIIIDDIIVPREIFKKRKAGACELDCVKGVTTPHRFLNLRGLLWRRCGVIFPFDNNHLGRITLRGRVISL